MKKYIPILKKTKMFAHITEDEIASLLSCLNAKLGTYKKGEYVFRQGEYLDRITVLLEGKLLIQKDDFWGNRTIINHIAAGEMFGEAYMSPERSAALNDVIADSDSVVMFFDVKRILTTCSTACRFHSMVVQNLFFAISEKNLQLIQKIGHISKRSTREKLLSYLSEQARQQKSNHIVIPFNRQQLADFLSVDRSAMSNELCKMRNEGLLQFEKNKFTLN